MSSDERSLYDDVTEYLLQPSLYAFAGSQRRLLLIGFHRRMASSIPALAASLENVAARLRRLKVGQRVALSTDDLRDLEDEEDVEVEAEEQTAPADSGAVAKELALVEDFVTRARSLPHDAKARSFQDAIRVVLERGRDGRGSGKAVVFTESITTQEYLRRLLLDTGLDDEDVTLFRGTNDHDRAKQAHARWVQEEGRNLPPGTRPTREVAVRLALVHEFRTRSKVLVCTEAGAKGLNLQFCETIINYDLPWNPQRIEQRIGRCHRYSQQRDVTVVNFIARDNEAHHLTFEILSQKLDLFGKVLDASDHVLHEPRTDAPETAVSAVSIEFENDLRRIYSRSRTLDEVTREIAALRDKIGAKREAFEKEYERTSQIIESRFDEDVRKVFKRLREELPAGLLQLDRDISDLVEGYLRSRGIRYTRAEADGRMLFDVADDADLPADIGAVRRFATGDARGLADAQSLNLLHPLVRAAIADARGWPGGSVELIADATPSEVAALQGQTGVLAIALIDYAGFEPVQRIVAGAVIGQSPVDPSLASRIARLRATDGQGGSATVDKALMDDALDEAVFLDQREVEKKEQKHFEQAIGQLERFVDDKILVCRRERASISEKLRSARDRRDEVVGSSARDRVEAEILRLAEKDEALERRINALASREDEVYRKWRNEYHELRYRAPKVTRLFQVAFRITARKLLTSC
jgi:adenine-specific DNA-methyltransferase